MLEWTHFKVKWKIKKCSLIFWQLILHKCNNVPCFFFKMATALFFLHLLSLRHTLKYWVKIFMSNIPIFGYLRATSFEKVTQNYFLYREFILRRIFDVLRSRRYCNSHLSVSTHFSVYLPWDFILNVVIRVGINT